MRKAAKLAINLIIAATITTMLMSCRGMKCYKNMDRDQCYNKCLRGLYDAGEYNESIRECCCREEW